MLLTCDRALCGHSMCASQLCIAFGHLSAPVCYRGCSSCRQPRTWRAACSSVYYFCLAPLPVLTGHARDDPSPVAHRSRMVTASGQCAHPRWLSWCSVHFRLGSRPNGSLATRRPVQFLPQWLSTSGASPVAALVSVCRRACPSLVCLWPSCWCPLGALCSRDTAHTTVLLPLTALKASPCHRTILHTVTLGHSHASVAVSSVLLDSLRRTSRGHCTPAHYSN